MKFRIVQLGDGKYNLERKIGLYPWDNWSCDYDDLSRCRERMMEYVNSERNKILRKKKKKVIEVVIV